MKRKTLKGGGDVLLKMVDGGILDVRSDLEYYEGCPTCNYGSSYINEYDIDLVTSHVHIEVSQMYEYLLSEGDMMKLLLSNVDEIKQMTESAFTDWLKQGVEAIAGITEEDKWLRDSSVEFEVTFKEVTV